MSRTLLVGLAVGVATTLSARAQQSQNPSPMVEHTRVHPRLKEETPPGRREKLELGTLFLPVTLKSPAPLFIHFHGGTWLPEVAAARAGKAAVISIQMGAGSGVYAKPFSDRELFARLIAEAEAKARTEFSPVGLTSWSAGYGAVREILKVPDRLTIRRPAGDRSTQSAVFAKWGASPAVRTPLVYSELVLPCDQG